MSVPGPMPASRSRHSRPVKPGHSATSAGTWARCSWARSTSVVGTPKISAEPAGGAQQPEQHADGRRLAGAVGTEEAEDLTARHREREVVDGEGRLEPLREALGAYGRRGVGVGGVADGGHAKPPRQPGTRLPTRLPGTPSRNLTPPDHRRKVPGPSGGIPPRACGPGVRGRRLLPPGPREAAPRGAVPVWGPEGPAGIAGAAPRGASFRAGGGAPRAEARQRLRASRARHLAAVADRRRDLTGMATRS